MNKDGNWKLLIYKISIHESNFRHSPTLSRHSILNFLRLLIILKLFFTYNRTISISLILPYLSCLNPRHLWSVSIGLINLAGLWQSHATFVLLNFLSTTTDFTDVSHFAIQPINTIVHACHRQLIFRGDWSHFLTLKPIVWIAISNTLHTYNRFISKRRRLIY